MDPYALGERLSWASWECHALDRLKLAQDPSPTPPVNYAGQVFVQRPTGLPALDLGLKEANPRGARGMGF